MNTQPEALRLAEFIDERWILCGEDADIVSAELRRLHEVNKELVEALEEFLRNPAGDNTEDIAKAALAKSRGTE